MVETVVCDAYEAGRSTVGAGEGVTISEPPSDEQSTSSLPQDAHCCPCLHTYAGAFARALIVVRPLLGSSTAFTFAVQASPDRHPQPLVPPPIV